MVVYVPMGNGCSPAGALRELGLRQFALPFDWISGDVNSVIRCIREDFDGFHRGVVLGRGRDENTVLIDQLGFKFHHDYPTTKEPTPVLEESGTYLAGRDEQRIVDNWREFYTDVHAKYQRRIERFRTILRGSQPVVICCRFSVRECQEIQNALRDVYGKVFMFVTSTCEKSLNPTIRPYDTERNGVWNDITVWKEALGI
jgi:hypothetical protein